MAPGDRRSNSNPVPGAIRQRIWRDRHNADSELRKHAANLAKRIVEDSRAYPHSVRRARSGQVHLHAYPVASPNGWRIGADVVDPDRAYTTGKPDREFRKRFVANRLQKVFRPAYEDDLRILGWYRLTNRDPYAYVLQEMTVDIMKMSPSTPDAGLIPAKDIYSVMFSEKELRMPCGDTFIDLAPFEIGPKSRMPVLTLFERVAAWADWDGKGEFQVLSLSPLGTSEEVFGIKSFQYRTLSGGRTTYSCGLPSVNSRCLQGPASLSHGDRLLKFLRREWFKRAGLIDPAEHNVLLTPARLPENGVVKPHDVSFISKVLIRKGGNDND